MRSHFIFCCILGCTILAYGCTKSSGIMEYSHDVYAVSVDVDSDFYGSGTAQKKAFDEATEFCKKQGKSIEVQSVKSDISAFNYSNATMIFRCL